MNGGRRWIGSDYDRQAMLPVVALGDLLSKGHLVWDVLNFVDALDLSQFEAAYRVDGVGRPPFAPKVMVGLILYAVSKKMRSDREIAQMCIDDVGARLIMGNRPVSRSTIIRFRTVHARALRGVLAQSVRIGRGMGLVDVSVVAGDGTKMSANSAMSTTVEAEVVTGQIAVLEKRLQDALRVWAAAVGGPDHPPAPLSGIEEWPDLEERADLEEGADLEEWPDLEEGADLEERADLDEVTDDVQDGVEVFGSGVAVKRAWRRVCVIREMLDARLKALEYLRTHASPRQDAEWQERLTVARSRVARAEVRVAAVLDRLQAVYDARQAQIAADRAVYAPVVGYRRPMVEPSRHSRTCRARDQLAAARAHLGELEANPPCMTRVNTTDPVSRIMPGKHGGFLQAYNVQIMASADQFILTVGTHDNPNDKQALVALVNGAQDTLDTADVPDSIGVALFDNGYASESNFTVPLPEGTLLLVSPRKEAVQTGRKPSQTTIGPAWQAMADRFEDPANVALYKRRAAIIEPVFAQIFNRTGHDLYHRDDVLTELHLLAITHNFLKIRRHLQRQRKRAAA